MLLGAAVQDIYATEIGASFHSYPKKKMRRGVWFVKLKMEKSNMSSSKVCSKHFKEDHLVYCIGAQMFGKCLHPSTVHVCTTTMYGNNLTYFGLSPYVCIRDR